MDRRTFMAGAAGGLVVPGQMGWSEYLSQDNKGRTDPEHHGRDSIHHKLIHDVAELMKWRAAHVGIDWAAAGVYSPHPNQEIAWSIIDLADIDRLRLGDNIWVRGNPAQTGDTAEQPWLPGMAIKLGSSGLTDAYALRWLENMNSSAGDEVYIYGSRVGSDPYLYLYVKEDSGNGSARIEIGDTTSAGYISLAAAGGGVTYEFIVSSGGISLSRNGVDQGAFSFQGGPEVVDFLAKSADYTTTANDGFITVDASGATRTITLVTAVGNAGLKYTIKKIDSSVNLVVIDGNGAQTIDGVATTSLSRQWESIVIVSDGANWLIESRY